MMRSICILLLALTFAARAAAQPDRPARPTHMNPVIQGIQRRVDELCDSHQKRLAAIGSEQELLAERERTRAKFIELLGLKLDERREPPKVRQVETLDFAEYTIEKLLVEADGGSLVPCNLYLPKGGPAKKPALLSPHGHGGRDWPHYQNAYQRFAKAGFIVLAKDGWGRQERRGTGHEAEGGQLFLTGGSLMALELWDNVRCIDYLAARDDVDAAKIGMVGTSGGGSQTLYATAVDPRIQAASPTCAVTSFQADLADTNMCVCEVNADLLTIGDHSTFLAMAYPRQWLVVNGTSDYIFPVQGTRASVAEAKRLYGLGEKPGAAGIELAEFPVGHAWNDEMLDTQIRFFRKAFGMPPLEKLPAGGDFVPYERLRTGDKSFDNASPLTISARNQARIPPAIKQQNTHERGRTIDADVAAWKERLAELWSSEPQQPEVTSRELAPDKQRFFLSRRLWWPSGLGGEVSAVVTRPANEMQQAKAKQAVFIRFTSEGPLDRVMQFTWTEVLKTEATVVELSYTGSDLGPQKEGESAMALLTAGRSLMAERIRDLLVLMLVLEKEEVLSKDVRLRLVARGNDAQLVLLASPLLPRDCTLVLDSMPVSYSKGSGIIYPDQLRAETSHWTVIPKLALRHDLLELVEMSRAKKAIFFHPLDNAWEPLGDQAFSEATRRLTRGVTRPVGMCELPRSAAAGLLRTLLEKDR